MNSPTCSVIGVGVIGSILAQLLLDQKKRVVLYDHNPSKLEPFIQKGAKEGKHLESAASDSEVIFLAIKPKDIDRVSSVFSAYKGTIVSSLAGVSIETIQKRAPHARIVRIMPSTVLQYGSALIGVCSHVDGVGEFLKDFLGPYNEYCIFDESKMDAFSAIHASSPALLLDLMQGFVRSGIAFGFSKEESWKIASSAFRSAAIIGAESDNLERAIQSICSPGGTTIEGILTLEREGVRSGMQNALEAIKKKSELLGK